MINVENFEVFNFYGALQGMRFPMNSNAKSDTIRSSENSIILGDNDKNLALRLIRAGETHAKFTRQILVSMDITAPLYWWKEMDTYKVATVANSESTMHRLAKTPITKECFSFDEELNQLEGEEKICMDLDSAGMTYYSLFGNDAEKIIHICEIYRQRYLETQDKRYWRALIQMLPTSWNQTRHWTSNYSTLLNIGHSRENHKLSEWDEFISFLKKNAPYYTEFLEAYNDRKN